MPPLYDAHNHFQDDWLAPHRTRVDADLRGLGLRRAVVNGTCEADWPVVAALARAHDWIVPSFGLHPWDAGNRSPDWQEHLRAALDAADRDLAQHRSTPPPSPPLEGRAPAGPLSPAALSGLAGAPPSRSPVPPPAGPPADLSAKAPAKAGAPAEVGLPTIASAKAGLPTAALAKAGLPTVALAKVGEIGLDRWILDRAKPGDPRLAGLRRAPLAEQVEVFAWQLELAAARNCAASIHCLDAFGALLDVLRGSRRPARGFLLHAYSGPAEMVKSFADLGACFSFNGSFLDGRHLAKQETFRRIPADRLLVETDAPAMRLPPAHESFPPLAAPDGSLANHPGNLAATYAALAALRGVPLDALAAQVEDNFHRLFGR